ncbi:MAG: hypothetical protein R3B65_03435 [Candidatus Paceibacterota bacterium]
MNTDQFKILITLYLIQTIKALNIVLERRWRNSEKEILIGDFMVNEKPAIGVGIQSVGIYKPPFFKAILESFKSYWRDDLPNHFRTRKSLLLMRFVDKQMSQTLQVQ